MISTANPAGGALAALFLSLGIAAGPAAAQSSGGGIGALGADRATVASRNADRTGDFDWYNPSGTRSAAATPVRTQRVTMRLIGRASWVCSPAGFGRTSTCTSR